MSLPASQQRVLDRIEAGLKRREPRLAAMFAMFARLTAHEILPRTEALKPVPWWSPGRYRAPARVRAVVLLSLAAAMVVSAVFASTSQSPGRCTVPIMLRGPLIGMTQVRHCPAVPQTRGYGHGP